MEKMEGGLRQGIVQALGGWGRGKKRGSERAREKKEGGLRQGAAIPSDWLILTVLSTLCWFPHLLSTIESLEQAKSKQQHAQMKNVFRQDQNKGSEQKLIQISLLPICQ